MSDPKSNLLPEYRRQPNTYMSNLSNNGYWDHGPNPDVHKNSGVQNFWFFLLCNGGSGTNDFNTTYSVTGIGINKARQIVYKNLTTYLGSNATYFDSYFGSLQAAEDLFPSIGGVHSQEYNSVKQAWYAVGIGTNPLSSCNGTTNLTASSGTFSDGSGNTNYGDNTNCSWYIAPAGANQITLSFSSFNTERHKDVKDNKNTSLNLKEVA
jgi:hypothetical protein